MTSHAVLRTQIEKECRAERSDKRWLDMWSFFDDLKFLTPSSERLRRSPKKNIRVAKINPNRLVKFEDARVIHCRDNRLWIKILQTPTSCHTWMTQPQKLDDKCWALSNDRLQLWPSPRWFQTPRWQRLRYRMFLLPRQLYPRDLPTLLEPEFYQLIWLLGHTVPSRQSVKQRSWASRMMRKLWRQIKSWLQKSRKLLCLID